MLSMSIIILKIVRHSITIAMAGRSPYLLEEQYKINIIPYYTISANYYLSSQGTETIDCHRRVNGLLICYMVTFYIIKNIMFPVFCGLCGLGAECRWPFGKRVFLYVSGRHCYKQWNVFLCSLLLPQTVHVCFMYNVCCVHFVLFLLGVIQIAHLALSFCVSGGLTHLKFN